MVKTKGILRARSTRASEKHHLGSQVDVDDGRVDGNVGVDGIGGLPKFTERADGAGAEGLQRPDDIVGEKILILHDENAASRQGSWTGWLEGHLSPHWIVAEFL